MKFALQLFAPKEIQCSIYISYILHLQYIFSTRRLIKKAKYTISANIYIYYGIAELSPFVALSPLGQFLTPSVSQSPWIKPRKPLMFDEDVIFSTFCEITRLSISHEKLSFVVIIQILECTEIELSINIT